MAGPFTITGAFAPMLVVGCAGAYRHGANLYAIAFLEDIPAPGVNSTLGIFKSTDDGVTWGAVGGTKTVVDSVTMGGDNFPPRQFGCCIDSDFPTTPYVYVAYADSSGELTVSRVDLSADDWAGSSSGGPDLTDADYNSFVRGYAIEQDPSTGDFTVTFTAETETTNNVAFTFQGLYACVLGAGLSGWTGPDLVAGQDTEETSGGTSSYHCHAMAKGSGGRVHAFVKRGELSGQSVAHFFALGGPGFVGSAFTTVASITSGGTDYGQFAIGLADASLIGVLYTDDGLVLAATSPSADVPSWTSTTVDPAGLFGGLMSENSGSLVSLYGDAAGINFATFNGSTWDLGTQLFTFGGDGFAMQSATIDANTLQLVYTPDFTSMVYRSYVLAVAGQTLTGADPIPTGEMFFASHGVTGGGDPFDCGETSLEPPPDGCEEGQDLPDAPECERQGIAY